MARTTFSESDFFAALEKAINKHISDKLDEVVTEAAEEARKRVLEEVRESTAEIALKLLSDYDLRYDQKRLVITVRTPEGEQR